MMRCIVARQRVKCEKCAGRAVRVFWELRVRKRHSNTLRVRKCCKQCDGVEWNVLSSAARVTMERVKERVAARGGRSPQCPQCVQDAFWTVLVKEREGELGTMWEECPVCGESHSVRAACTACGKEVWWHLQ